MELLFLLMFIDVTQAGTNTGSCKDMLQGCLTGQLSSALGAYQVEALRREFKSFTDVIEKSMKKFKENMKSEVKTREIAVDYFLRIKQRIQVMNYIYYFSTCMLISLSETTSSNSSAVYIRWGKKTCPSNAELIHSGFTGGSHYGHKGAAVEPLCLPRNPAWGLYNDGLDGTKSYVYGAEYKTGSFRGYIKTVDSHDVPCALCLVRHRSVVQMFPARKTCYKGWTLEYHGYLMTGHYTHAAGTTYTCVDSHPDTLHGGATGRGVGYMFYMVEAACDSLTCHPYVAGRELVCVVCSRK
ncbi:uncharacterized protein LOC128180225 isoform X1 [Crassostrea angulata]|uniref:uncharacterized protein LOC128180225 isoform X1 n=1 Tax=Magallana angulata TaxID=2784310 RepID=UPI0022B127B8|nr:uncharacterized protein LOC128180225 isoform X1 [Crassostrea angulata]